MDTNKQLVLNFPLSEEKLDQVLDILVDESETDIVIDLEGSNLDEVLLFLTNFAKINQYVKEIKGDMFQLITTYLKNPFYNIPDSNIAFWRPVESLICLYALQDGDKSDAKLSPEIRSMLNDYKTLLVQIIHHSIVQNSEKMDYTYYSRDNIEARCQAEGRDFLIFKYNPNIQPLLTSKSALLVLLSMFLKYEGGTGYLDRGVFYFSNMENILCGSPYCPSVVIRFLLDKITQKE